jgi:RNA polymerase sigma factor (TIGR02999 family)
VITRGDIFSFCNDPGRLRMPQDATRSVTQLLGDLREGDRLALDALIGRLYAELRRLAGAKLAREHNSTLTPTGLVHEAFLRMVGQHAAAIHDRAHFLSVAAMVMRRVLVDRARERLAAKRGAGARSFTLDPELGVPADADSLAVHEAVERLEAMHQRQARVVICRFFGGMTDEEIAVVLDVSVPTVRRDWRVARAWLVRELSAGAAAS